MTKTVSTSKKPRKQHSPEFRSEALKLAERIGVTAAAVNSACMNHSSTTGAVNSSNR
ncbi:iS3 element protein InsE [Escherichia coli O6:H16 str. F5656C1]|nr:iS3 element protein InsE [Escherichia coli O6:H16 str. F5656C1]